uniref:non-specific serine/threonine protein kinase n=1 Tax=Strongyloides venezuelensis TaxID=75913 RepID=A0A0K0FVF0_STRVS
MNVQQPEIHLSPIFPKPSEKSIVNEDVDDYLFNELTGKRVHGFNIEKKLGEGGFGVVYKCNATTKKGVIINAAFKAERNTNNNTPSMGLLFECKVLQKLEESDNNSNFVSLYSCGLRKNFTFMVMLLLGPNLYDICCYLPGEKFEQSTWIRVSYQILQAIKSLHNIGYIHNDLKPSNFTIGDKDDENGSTIIYLIDFGLSRIYGTKESPRPPVFTEEKRGIEYIGTITHCSPNAHKRVELGRRDDMYAWMYIMMDFYNELPWRRCDTDKKIEDFKLNCDYETYCKYLPKSCNAIIKHILNLSLYDEPKYDLLGDRLKKIMKECKIRMNDHYQWELLPIEAKKALNLKVELRKIKKSNNRENNLSSKKHSRKGRIDNDSTRRSNSRKKIARGYSLKKQTKRSIKDPTSKKSSPVGNKNVNSPNKHDGSDGSPMNNKNMGLNNIFTNISHFIGKKGNKKAKANLTVDDVHQKDTLTQDFNNIGDQNVDEKIDKRRKIKKVKNKGEMDCDSSGNNNE